MDFAERIAAEIKRGNMRNHDDEAITALERQFLSQGAETLDPLE